MPEESGRSPEEDLRDEASDWFGRMHGEPNDDVRQEFENWLNADPRHRQTYERLIQRWDQSIFAGNSDLGRNRDLGRIATVPHRYNAKVAVAILLPLLIFVIGIAGFNVWRGGHRNPADRVAEREYRLPDGSRALLTGGAVVRLAFAPRQRQLFFEGGSGRFFVASDPARPFIVEVGGGAVIAHGTVFDISVHQSAVRIGLVEGLVDVVKPGANERRPITLRPGQSVSFDADHSSSRTAAANVSGSPMLVFDATSLADAVAQFNRRNRQQLELAPGAFREVRISGAFHGGDPAGFASVIADAFHLKVNDRSPDAILIVPGSAGLTTK